MKKSTLTLMVLTVFAMSVFGTETNSRKNLFAGFDGVELTSQEASLITGGETYIGFTPILGVANHSLTVVTDKPITDPDFKVLEVFESGPKRLVSGTSSSGSSSSGSSWSLNSSSFGYGDNVRQKYNKPEAVEKKYKDYDLTLVQPPKGMSTDKYDALVIETAEKYFEEPAKKYSVSDNSCNTTTSIIINKTKGSVTFDKWVPGWKK